MLRVCAGYTHKVRLRQQPGPHSLELRFVKFGTVKNREKLNPLNVCSNRCYMPENNTEDV